MGDKGGKKDKEKSQKQNAEKREALYLKLIALKKLKTQSELHGDVQSVPTEMLDTKTQ